jgi:hypothetical protein
MSKHMSRQVELGVSTTNPAIVAMGHVSPAMFGSEPWKDPSVPRLTAVSAELGYVPGLPAEYKVAIGQ